MLDRRAVIWRIRSPGGDRLGHGSVVPRRQTDGASALDFDPRSAPALPTPSAVMHGYEGRADRDRPVVYPPLAGRSHLRRKRYDHFW
jgi:hypothetical protein